MGRRSTHTPEELRELILSAAEEIIEAGGLAQLSAREVARRIEYSPGTLYNMFENLADLILHVEARVLTRLDERLLQATSGSNGKEAIRRFAHTYLEFSHEQPHLWNLLFEHMPQTAAIPSWYRDKIEQPLRRLEHELTQLSKSADKESCRRKAQALWAGLHGVASLSTAPKISNFTFDAAKDVLDELVGSFLSGFDAQIIS